ncbi:MAG: molybdopterin synthase sulfur carrier subunit [Comamonadaceae bacterium CG_4_9_14_3_um_filter_60_33]|nr:MAG: molybdopterin synthase sulfur carrier subunit [Comamonadaceae bacterium CG2_30_59_20]PIY28183.1 MAG: molybdopterin synthase sulfur carrier subunit [Comamonadaceae bacterium CG_4_10_14_3_um_filter_60_42]PJB42339.1 MAG: molybdopterin synthase sulfur carrier subunit [Comamonadaceae bacterium CG_4_9_14_3_um_filter_60_33]
MKITLKLFASLTDYLPDSAKYTNFVELDVVPASTIAQVVEQQRLPEKWVHLVLLNGHYVAPEQRLAQTLNEGDVLAIWPPIAGG